MTVSYIVSI